MEFASRIHKLFVNSALTSSVGCCLRSEWQRQSVSRRSCISFSTSQPRVSLTAVFQFVTDSYFPPNTNLHAHSSVKLGERTFVTRGVLQGVRQFNQFAATSRRFSSMAAEKVLMVLDCDAGVDDATALMIALCQSNVEMLGITCCAGNVGVDKVSINVLRVLKKCNRLDIPVYVGASSGILYTKTPQDAADQHGSDGLGDIPNPEAPPSQDLLKSEHGVPALIRMVNERPQQITLVTIGPLTNVALAMRLDPTFTSKLKELVIMGGNIRGRGTGYWTAEFNFGIDPEAAHIVLEEVLCPTLLVPLETCMEHGISYEWFEKLGAMDNPRAQFMYAINEHSVRRSKKNGLQNYMCCDALAMAAAVRRDAVMESTHSTCKVELQGQLTRGQVITEKLNSPWIPDLPGNQIEVVTKMDMILFYKLMNEASS